MGLHTGEPLVTDGHYVGIDVHRGARIAAAAHGGQVVISERTQRARVRRRSACPSRSATSGCTASRTCPNRSGSSNSSLDGLPSSFPPLRTHEEAIEAAGLPDYSLPPADVPCPYKGLLPFQPEDSELFFGREQLVKDLAERLRGSSFSPWWGRRGAASRRSCGRAWCRRCKRASWATRGARRSLRPGRPPPACSSSAAARRALSSSTSSRRSFTLCRDEEERRAFIEALLDRARGRDASRSSLCEPISTATAPRTRASLPRSRKARRWSGPMTEEEFRRAIERPAEHAGLVLEPGLVEAVVARRRRAARRRCRCCPTACWRPGSVGAAAC